MTVNKRPPGWLSSRAAASVAHAARGRGRARAGTTSGAAASRPDSTSSHDSDMSDDTSWPSSAPSTRSGSSSSVGALAAAKALAPISDPQPATHVLPPVEALSALLAALARQSPAQAATSSLIGRAQALFLAHGPLADTLRLLHDVRQAQGAHGSLGPLCDRLMQQVYRHPAAALAQAQARLQAAVEVLHSSGRPGAAAEVQQHATALRLLQTTDPRDPYAHLEHSIQALSAAAAALGAQRAGISDAARILSQRTLTLSTKVARLTTLRIQAVLPDETRTAVLQAIDTALEHLQQAQTLDDVRRSLSVDEAQLRPVNPQGVAARSQAIEGLSTLLNSSHAADAEELCLQALRGPFAAAVIHRLRGDMKIYSKLSAAIDTDSRQALLAAVDEGTPLTSALRQLPAVPVGVAVGGAQPYGAYLQRQVLAAQQQAMRALVATDSLAPVALDLAERLASLTPSPAQRHDNRSGRAFETLLADELIQQMPAPTSLAWQQLGQGAAEILAPMDNAQMTAFAAKLHAVLEERGVRPWDGRAPELAALIAGLPDDPSGVTLLQRTLELLRAPVGGGYGVLVKAELLRATWASLGEVHLSQISEVQLAQQRFYMDAIGPRARREPQVAAAAMAATFSGGLQPGAGATAANVTLMATHQAKPIEAVDLIPASSAGLRYHVEIDDPHVAQFLATGAVVASGVSGSTNTLMGWLAHLQRNRPDLHATADDVLLGAAAFLIHDAGHSLNEVMWTVTHAPGMGQDADIGLQPAQTYRDFQARFANNPTVQSVISRAFERLSGYTASLAAQGRDST